MLLPEQKRQQITHLLFRDRRFQTIRHQRAIQTLHVFDRGAGECFFRAAGHGEDDGVGGFALDEASEGAAVSSFDLVAAPAGFEHAVGVQNVAEQGFGGLHFDVGEWRADIDAELAVLVAGDADGGEDLLAFFGVAGLFGGVEVAGDDFGAVAVGLAEELFGEFGHFAFAALVSPAFFDIDPSRRELALFHALEEFERGGGVGGEEGHEVAFEAGTAFGQEFINERGGAGGAEFLQQGHGGRGELQRLRGGEQVPHHGLDGGPFPRGEQRQHGEALIERGFGIGDDGVDLRLKRGDLFGDALEFSEFKIKHATTSGFQVWCRKCHERTE